MGSVPGTAGDPRKRRNRFSPGVRGSRTDAGEREFSDLKALIYFTDGDGIYPEKKPDYETAFVFVKKSEKMDRVPGWAKKLLVTEQ